MNFEKHAIWFVLIAALAGCGESDKPAEPASAPPAAAAADDSEESVAERRALMASRTAVEQQELRRFLDELQAMRPSKEFHEFGFSAANQTADDWKQRVEAWRSRIEKDDDIAFEVRTAPGYLLLLGLEWMRKKGAMTDDAKFYVKMLNEALNWNPNNEDDQ